MSDQFGPRAPPRGDRLADAEVELTQLVAFNLALRNRREVHGSAVRIDGRQHAGGLAVPHVLRRPGHVVGGVIAADTSAAAGALPVSLGIDSCPGADRRLRAQGPTDAE